MSHTPTDQRPIHPMPPTAASSTVLGTGPNPVSSIQNLPPAHKRTRVLLSCGPCRLSKQKCNRQQPCTNCVKKSKEELCTYVPKPEKPKSDRSMATRLKRLEGMVKEMMHTQQPSSLRTDPGHQVQDSLTAAPEPPTVLTAPRDGTTHEADDQEPLAQVVVNKDGHGTYIGATHFMAMLDDIEDLKSYFDDDEEDTLEDGSTGAGTGPYSDSPDGPQQHHSSSASPSDMLLFSVGAQPTCKQDLVEMLPPRHVVDRLIQRYFSATTPSHHCVHKPTFDKQCDAFWCNPTASSTRWLSLLWIIISQGTLLSNFTAPDELSADYSPPIPPMDRFRQYRSASLQALMMGGLSSPTLTTLQAALIYAESEFLVNRKTQMNVYYITSVTVRMMLRMGLHRDSSKLPNLSPFEGEMRRRLWHVACQFDLLVSFHLGLPSMVDRIESDTALPKNLTDADISPDSLYLPDPRPDTEYTPLTYPIWKSATCQVFGLIASRLTNSLKAPNYIEVMYLDRQLNNRWAQVPEFMRRVRPPPDNSFPKEDSPQVLNQRFGLASLYQKSRCVLHRRYLTFTHTIPSKRSEHAYSRRTCLEAAIALLDYQEYMHLATLPGGALRSSGWFITALAKHDFMLAAMIVYLVLLNEQIDYSSGGDDNKNHGGGDKPPPLPDRNQLFEILDKSYRTWVVIAQDDPAAVKAAETLGIMLRKLRDKKGYGKKENESSQEEGANSEWQIVTEPLASVGSLSVSDEPWVSEMNFDPADHNQVPLLREGLMPSVSFDAPWLDVNMTAEEMDWKTFDDAMSGQNSNMLQQDVEDWIEQGSLLPDVSLMSSFGFQGPFV
ncbi:fungal-specific transcription factor domain-containing protein [Cladorrhinum sp. PSN259]|nr:fungal-specific transcription factor domain-containing protein [Cladorrhinum sp. PSN259]